MKKIRLKDEYPWYSGNEYIEVADEIADVFTQSKKETENQRVKAIYHKAFYSLDAGDGIEKDILYVSATPDELYEKKLTQEELYSAISQLPEKQAKRIYARFFQDMTMTEIAKIESVSVMAISKSIEAGLKKIEKILKTGFKED